MEREKDKPRRTTSRTKSALRTKRDIAFLNEFHRNRVGYGLARTMKSTRSGELDMAQHPSASASARQNKSTASASILWYHHLVIIVRGNFVTTKNF